MLKQFSNLQRRVVRVLVERFATYNMRVYNPCCGSEAIVRAERKVRRKAWRAQMFGDNLILLDWNLRYAGRLEQPKQSSFDRSVGAFDTFIEQNNDIPSIGKVKPKPQFCGRRQRS